MKLSRIRGAFPWRMAVIPFERSALLLIKSLGSATQSGPVGVKRGVHFISAGSIGADRFGAGRRSHPWGRASLYRSLRLMSGG
jgi:hypothetical protein